MKLRMPLFIIVVAFMAVIAIAMSAHAFNLWEDVQQQTQWTLGSSVEAGTAVAIRHDDSLNLKAGQFVGSALAQISNYRMLSLWAGGNFIPQDGGTLKAQDAVKIGFNLGYLFKDFANQPPDIIKNLVVGPSISTSLVSTPHVVIPWFDINYQFGGAAK